MSCGCGGECCKQPKGLGFIYTGGDDSSGDYYDYPYIEGGDGWDYWYAPYYGSYDDSYVQDTSMFGGYDPNSVIDRQFISDRLPDQTNGSAWQQLLDWWDRFTGQQSAIQQPSGSGYDERGLPGYCPAGYYHPLNDPYICVPFPAETPAQKAQRQKAQQQQQTQQQQQKKQQQAQQPCAPNTGLTKNAQGQCVCPNGYAFSKTYQKCVLTSQLTAEDKKALEGSDLWKYLALIAFGVIGVKALQK